MSKSNQESSPITQWREKIQKTVMECVDFQDYEHRQEIHQAITSATIELIEGLIGEDDDPNEVFTDEFSGEKRHAFWNSSRNSLRQELRIKLEELK